MPAPVIQGHPAAAERGSHREQEKALLGYAQSQAGAVGVRRIERGDEAPLIALELVAGARRETLSALPSGPYPLEMLRSSWDVDSQMCARGVAARVLYQADAARRPDTLGYLSEFAAIGAQVRVSPRVTHRTIIVDRATVMVATNVDSLGAPMLLITEPAMVNTFCAQFAALWRNSHSVGVGPESSLSDESVREILGVLKSGVTDDVAGRQLGISVRTVRRRVAAVLDLLGASSRFEAGVKAAQSGWL